MRYLQECSDKFMNASSASFMPPMKGGCSANAINAVLCPYGRVILYVPGG